MSEVSKEDVQAKVDALRKQLAQHPGKISRDRWDELRRSTNVFARNVSELRMLLSAGETKEELAVELIQNVRTPTVRDEYAAQLDQRLHNMIASSSSLVDHTRRLLRNYAGTEFSAEFESLNHAVATAPVSLFLRRLRNYLLHYGMAPFVFTLHIGNDVDMDSQISLSCATLLEWPDWGGARGYIVSAGEAIRLSRAVDEFSTAMKDLYTWVFAQFEGLHSGDIDGANLLVEQINLTLTGGLHDMRGGFPFDLQASVNEYRQRMQDEAKLSPGDPETAEDGAPARPQTVRAPKARLDLIQGNSASHRSGLTHAILA